MKKIWKRISKNKHRLQKKIVKYIELIFSALPSFTYFYPQLLEKKCSEASVHSSLPFCGSSLLFLSSRGEKSLLCDQIIWIDPLIQGGTISWSSQGNWNWNWCIEAILAIALSPWPYYSKTVEQQPSSCHQNWGLQGEKHKQTCSKEVREDREPSQSLRSWFQAQLYSWHWG